MCQNHNQLVLSLCLKWHLLFLGGIDTSRITMMWVVIFMARNLECQRKLQQEIQQVLGEIFDTFVTGICSALQLFV